MKLNFILPIVSRLISYLAVFSTVVLIAHNPAYADDTAKLTLQPKKCAVLRKGKKCYKNIKISFSAVKKGDYCLRTNYDRSPLKCWKNSVDGKLSYDFKSESSVQFYLYQGTDVVIAESEFTVAWVYSNRRRNRNHWRLF